MRYIFLFLAFFFPALSSAVAAKSDKTLYYFVIDKSYSIETTSRLTKPIWDTVTSFVSDLPESSEVRLIFFNEKADGKKTWKTLKLEDKQSFVDQFQKYFVPKGQTRLFDTVAEVIEEVDSVSSDYGAIRILILSDGMNEVPPDSKPKHTNWQSVEKLACALRQHNDNAFVIWFTLGFKPKDRPSSDCIMTEEITINPNDPRFCLEPAPIANIYASVGNAKVGEEVIFLVKPSPGRINKVYWDFGDGTNDSGDYIGHGFVQHKFNKPQNYAVTLKVNGWCDKEAISQPTQIKVDVIPPPKAIFSWSPPEPRVGSEIHFFNRSEGTPDRCEWSFGDYGKSTDSSPTFSPTNKGPVSVSLTIWRGSESNTMVATIPVLPLPPLPDFNMTPDKELEFGSTLSLQANSTDPSLQHEWIVDGVTLSYQGPSGIWSSDRSGLLEILHRITGEGGVTSSTKSIYVKPPVPPVKFTMPQQTTLGDTVQIAAESTDPNWKHSWDIDGQRFEGPSIIWPVAKAGTVVVKHMVDGFGVTGAMSQTIYVSDLDARFTILPDEPTLDLGTELALNASKASPQWEHSWIIDGVKSSETGENLKWRADKAGTVTIVHTVTSKGKTAQDIRKIQISIKDKVVCIATSPTSGNFPLEVKFSDKSEGEFLDRRWDFGDGSPSISDANTIHVYREAGKFTVTLTRTNKIGKELVCLDPIVIQIGTPPPWWTKYAVAAIIVLIVAIVALLLLREPLPSGRIMWTYGGETKADIEINKRGFDITKLEIPGWQPKDRYVIRRKRFSGEMSIVRGDGTEFIPLSSDTEFEIDGVKFRYINEMLA